MGEVRIFGTYLLAVFAHWQAYVTGGGVTALLVVYEKMIHPIPRRVFVWIVLVFFVSAATFAAWHDAYASMKGREADLRRTEGMLLIEQRKVSDLTTQLTAAQINRQTPTIPPTIRVLTTTPLMERLKLLIGKLSAIDASYLMSNATADAVSGRRNALSPLREEIISLVDNLRASGCKAGALSEDKDYKASGFETLITNPLAFNSFIGHLKMCKADLQ